MKKLFLLMFFILASFSMNANSQIQPIQNDGCAEYAANAANAEEDEYGEMCSYDWGNVAVEYYDMCMDSGGSDNILEPIFL
jgi:hypothetical protein